MERFNKIDFLFDKETKKLKIIILIVLVRQFVTRIHNGGRFTGVACNNNR